MPRWKKIVLEKREYIVSAPDEEEAWAAEVDDEGEFLDEVDVVSVEFYDHDGPDEPDCMDLAKAKREEEMFNEQDKKGADNAKTESGNS